MAKIRKVKYDKNLQSSQRIIQRIFKKYALAKVEERM